MKKLHNVRSIAFTKDAMVLDVDGHKYRFRLADISERLAKASEEQRRTYVVSAAGYGIHWPMIDEDLSIDGLLGVRHKPPKRKQLASA